MLFLVIMSFVISVKAMDKNENPDFVKIDEYIKSQMKLSGIPGLSISIVKKNNIVFTKGYGSIDSSGAPITNKTPFIIGSTSKSFTAVAIMQLVEAGKIELDAPVQKYIPWFKVADENLSSKITVRYLLNHTSGISTYAAPLVVSRSDLFDLESYIHKLSKVKLNKPVGTTWQYSNENYQILGLIVQEVSGISYEEYIEKNIFSPLEMKHSYTSKIEAEKDGLTVGHRVWFGFPIEADLPYLSAYISCGYIISSAEDMSNYLISQINNGKYKNKSILSPKGIEEMHKSAVLAFDNTYYGMGWMRGETNEILTIKHGGNIGNYSSDMYIIPEGDWGIIILSNIDNAIYTPVTTISDGVVSILKGKQPPNKVQSYLKSYILIDIFVIIIIIIQIYLLLTVKLWYNKLVDNKLNIFRHFIILSLINFIIPLFILIRCPWYLLLYFLPDIGYTILISCLLLMFLGIVKSGLIIFVVRKKTNNTNTSIV